MMFSLFTVQLSLMLFVMMSLYTTRTASVSKKLYLKNVDFVDLM